MGKEGMSKGEFGGWWSCRCGSEGGLWLYSVRMIWKDCEGRFGGVG